MSEASTRSGGHEQRRPGAVKPLQDESSSWRPQPGLEVAGYTLEARLGTGGQGTVFRASRQGCQYAVKFLFLPRSARWAWRERDVMRKLSHAGGLPLVDEGVWPAHAPLYLFLVMPLVRGLPLHVWTRVNNPSALEVAQLFGQGARQLSVVHAAGVVHRDVKGANLLVYGEGRVVLVDFGVATYEGAPPVTGAFPRAPGPTSAPGCGASGVAWRARVPVRATTCGRSAWSSTSHSRAGCPSRAARASWCTPSCTRSRRYRTSTTPACRERWARCAGACCANIRRRDTRTHSRWTRPFRKR
ncbi:protein kinase [Archangium gephyra]|nr:protein kinase [Archangium gephyra]